MKFFKDAPEPINKSPLTYEELREIIDLSLWAGQLLLQHGADTQRIEEVVHHIGTGLGCDWLDIFISSSAIIITASSAGEFRTKTRRVVHTGVNLDIVVQVSDLSYRVSNGKLDRHALKEELQRISQMRHAYPLWVTTIMIGLACASLSRLFEGDTAVFIITFCAASLAMLVRQQLTRLYFNAFLITIVTAFTAGLFASIAANFSPQPQIALAASVLLLVPGVQFINGVQDLIRGHVIVGVTRSISGALIALAIAVGLLLAMSLTGITGI